EEQSYSAIPASSSRDDETLNISRFFPACPIIDTKARSLLIPLLIRARRGSVLMTTSIAFTAYQVLNMEQISVFCLDGLEDPFSPFLVIDEWTSLHANPSQRRITPP
ncbi:MAG TPA: hypothetical protein VLE22_13530, partial [Bryobacteraceae bacterium]|nr:hypothetical protein [Bryobacteraceae bacterium]